MSVKEDKEKLPQEVNVAVKVIKSVILESQRRAASKVNSEQLALYLGIGRYISEHSRKGFWGTGAIECISTQLQRELPGLRGFGARQLKNMRSFYENWKPYLNSAAMAAELKNDAVSHQQMGTISDKDRIIVPVISENWQPMAAEIQIKEFLGISFTHHIEIISKTKDLPEQVFYIHQAYTNHWDKYKLRDMLKSELYHHQGLLPNNFSKTIPSASDALKAIEMFKDEYLLDFINVEELGARDSADVDEREVEQAIINNVKNFIMTFGHDFTFVGNQYHLEKYGHIVFLTCCFTTVRLLH